MKFVNTSITPQDLSDGSIVAPGETVTVNELDDYIQMKVDAGLLVEVVEPSAKPDKQGGKD